MPSSASTLRSRGAPTNLDISDGTVALANLSHTLDVMVGDVELALWYQQYKLKESMITAGLLTMFFGLFTVLAAVAAYVLFSKGISHRARVVMLVAIIVMWISTAAYWIANLVAAADAYAMLWDLTSSLANAATTMEDCLHSLSGSNTELTCSQGEPRTGISSTNGVQACTGTAVVAVNVTIGDAIVWWRAWVLWPDNCVVRWVCVTMILLTGATGVVNTIEVCSNVETSVIQEYADPGVSFNHSGGSQTFVPSPITTLVYRTIFGGSVYGIAAGLFSLFTNVAATALIAYRAWMHRRLIMSYLKGCSPRTQVERTLALLVESGVLYSALWIAIVVHEFGEVFLDNVGPGFAQGFGYVMNGCLVPIIGMYPTLIIILCAVDKSLHEKSAEHEMHAAPSLVFCPPSNRRRGTLSEILSTSSVHNAAVEDTTGPSEHPEDAMPQSLLRET